MYVDRAQAPEGPAQEGQGEGEVCHDPFAEDDGAGCCREQDAADAPLPPAPTANARTGSQAPPGTGEGEGGGGTADTGGAYWIFAFFWNFIGWGEGGRRKGKGREGRSAHVRSCVGRCFSRIMLSEKSGFCS